VGCFVGVRVTVGASVGGAEKGVEQPSGNRAKIIRKENLNAVFINTPVAVKDDSLLLEEKEMY